MESLKEIIAKRSAPGVLVLDLEGRLLYSNQEALELLVVLQGGDGGEVVPREVYDLCGRLKGHAKQTGAVFGVIMHGGGAGEAEAHCSLRAFLLGDHREGSSPAGHVMVLLEKINRNRQVDVEKARLKFQLSKRETEVVRLICQGLGNREIAAAIFISEFTVKDHLKSIMRKMDVGSRNEIVAALL